MAGSGLQPLCFFLAIFPSILCVLLVSLRITTRLRGSKYGIEDKLLIISTLLNVVLSFTTCGYILAAYYGYHATDIPEGVIDPISMMKWNYANSVIYNPILALVKASFIWTLIKLRSQNKWINRCLWTTLGLNGCFAIAAPLACIFQCNPVSRYWNPRVDGHCVDAGAYTVSTSSVVLGTDVLILLMPSWILHDLRMPLGRKLMVIAFLSFGIAVTIVGAVRTSVLVKVFVVKEVVPDPTYSVNYTLSNIESGLAIIGTCGPTIKYILSWCFPALKVADESSNRHYVYPSGGVSQARSRSRRYTKQTKSHDTTQQIDEIELKDAAESEHERTDYILQRNDHVMIKKAVQWQVDTAQPESSSAHEQRMSTPHDMLQ